MKDKIEYDANRESYSPEDFLAEEYILTKRKINDLEETLKRIENDLGKLSFETVKVVWGDIGLTITPSKIVKKLNYDKTFEENPLFNPDKFKTEVISFKWNDELIKDALKDKVIYDDVVYKVRILTTKIKK